MFSVFFLYYWNDDVGIDVAMMIGGGGGGGGAIIILYYTLSHCCCFTLPKLNYSMREWIVNAVVIKYCFGRAKNNILR